MNNNKKITTEELAKAVKTVREYEALKKQTEKIIEDNKEILKQFMDGEQLEKYVGDDFKLSYKDATRETLSKDVVKSLLSEEDFLKAVKISSYKALRIN
ncbi:MAG: hypothetical protein MJ231_02200 [bacterium]|nr:hypothetical protein [bacterium]